jgi:CheY-like chemotaxis protein
VRIAYAIRSGRNFGRNWSLSVQPHIARPEAGIAPNPYNNEARMKFTIVNSEAERREGLKALLRHIDRRARFNEAKDWRQAASAILRLDPDMIVIDWHDAMRMADLRTLLSAFPRIPAAIIVDEASTAQVRMLLSAGVLGVVPRDLDPTLIVRALEMVLLGGHYVPACALDPTLEPVFLPRRDTGPNRAAAVAIYNGWQNGYLEVLKREADASPRPALGDAGPVPLRAAALLTYAPRPEIEEHLLPMAAQPQPRFGD